MSSGAYDAEPALPCDLSRPYGQRRPIRRGVLPESKAVLLERVVRRPVQERSAIIATAACCMASVSGTEAIRKEKCLPDRVSI